MKGRVRRHRIPETEFGSSCGFDHGAEHGPAVLEVDLTPVRNSLFLRAHCHVFYVPAKLRLKSKNITRGFRLLFV